MNLFIRFGQWLEKRRVLRTPDLHLLELKIENVGNHIDTLDTLTENKILTIEKREDKIYETIASLITTVGALAEKVEANQVPQTVAKEFALTKIRLDKLELYVGLKRDPQPERIPDAPRIS